MDKLGKAGGKDDCSAVMDEVEKLKKEIAKLKQDLMNMLLALENQLNAKAENQALLDLEGECLVYDLVTILAKLESIVQGLTKKLADKADTKKALKLLEKQVGFSTKGQIKNIYDLLQSRHGNEDEAMFSKKPLGGISCASCEKDLVNLYGRQADH